MWFMKAWTWDLPLNRKIEQDKIVKDYIKIEYRDGGNLYLPATRLEGIQKYAEPMQNSRSSINWAAQSGIRQRQR